MTICNLFILDLVEIVVHAILKFLFVNIVTNRTVASFTR
jgi:hypothetical protein